MCRDRCLDARGGHLPQPKVTMLAAARARGNSYKLACVAYTPLASTAQPLACERAADWAPADCKPQQPSAPLRRETRQLRSGWAAAGKRLRRWAAARGAQDTASWRCGWSPTARTWGASARPAAPAAERPARDITWRQCVEAHSILARSKLSGRTWRVMSCTPFGSGLGYDEHHSSVVSGSTSARLRSRRRMSSMVGCEPCRAGRRAQRQHPSAMQHRASSAVDSSSRTPVVCIVYVFASFTCKRRTRLPRQPVSSPNDSASRSTCTGGSIERLQGQGQALPSSSDRLTHQACWSCLRHEERWRRLWGAEAQHQRAAVTARRGRVLLAQPRVGLQISNFPSKCGWFGDNSRWRLIKLPGDCTRSITQHRVDHDSAACAD
jgi:hypothetical protein